MPRSSRNKDYKFSAEVILLKSGKIRPGSICSANKVISLSNAKQNKKESIRTVAKVFSDHVAFKNKLPNGSKKKKLLRYEVIVLMDQSTEDRRKLFLQCEKPGKAYYFLLGFTESSNVSDLIQVVSAANTKVLVRGEPVLDSDVTSVTDVYDTNSEKAKINGDLIDYIQPNYNDHTLTMDDESINESSLPTFMLNGALACETYISPWDDENDKVHSIPAKCEHDHRKNIPQDPVPTKNSNNSRYSNNKNSVTTYTYVGPKGDEDSINWDNIYKKHKSMEVCNHRVDNAVPQNLKVNGFKPSLHNLPIKHHSNGETYSVRSRRPKSRQLPLSEEEKVRSGWHSGFIFVTPKPGGGNAITEDGPVVLFSASRTNVNNTSDDDDTEDSDEDLSCSSSTLSDEDDEIDFDRSSYFMHGLPRRT